MLSTFGACNSQTGINAREYALRCSGRRRPDDVFHASGRLYINYQLDALIIIYS